jgi:branched-chain amino acid transport system substrate-binding protein
MVVGVVVVAGVVIPAPAARNEAVPTIKIVSSLPRSGSAKGQTDTIVDGIRLALSEIDSKVTLGGVQYQIEYKDLDDATAAAGAWTAEAETANANLARRDQDVMVYIGTYNSGAASISMPILNQAHLLMVSPANTAVGLTKPGLGERDEPKRYRPTGEINYVRVVPTDDFQGAAGAEWTKALGCKSVYILDDNEVYGKGIADLYEAHARKIGLNVLGHESIDSKAQEFSALMTKIKSKAPDMLYFGGTTQSKAGQVAKDLASYGPPGCKMMAPDGCYELAMINSAGADVLNDRFYVTFGGLTTDKLAETPGGKNFFEKYKALYGKEPAEAYALYGYESGRIAIEAIKRAGKKDRDAIRKAALSIRNFPGVTGTWSFDENGDTTQQEIFGIVVRNGKFVFVSKLTVTQK